MDNLQQKLHVVGGQHNKETYLTYKSDESRRSSRVSTHSMNNDFEEVTLTLPIFKINLDSSGKESLYDTCSSEYESDAEIKSDISETNEISITPEEESDENLNKGNTPYKSEEIDVFREISEDALKELEEAFELFDLNGDGLITHADLKRTFISLGQEVADEEVTKMLAEGSKPLDFEGFVRMVGTKAVSVDTEEALTEALSKWDYNRTGLIPISRLRQDLMSCGDRFTEAEVEWALEEAPTVTRRGMTMIEYRDFCQFLCGMRKKNDP